MKSIYKLLFCALSVTYNAANAMMDPQYLADRGCPCEGAISVAISHQNDEGRSATNEYLTISPNKQEAASSQNSQSVTLIKQWKKADAGLSEASEHLLESIKLKLNSNEISAEQRKSLQEIELLVKENQRLYETLKNFIAVSKALENLEKEEGNGLISDEGSINPNPIRQEIYGNNEVTDPLDQSLTSKLNQLIDQANEEDLRKLLVKFEPDREFGQGEVKDYLKRYIPKIASKFFDDLLTETQVETQLTEISEEFDILNSNNPIYEILSKFAEKRRAKIADKMENTLAFKKLKLEIDESVYNEIKAEYERLWQSDREKAKEFLAAKKEKLHEFAEKIVAEIDRLKPSVLAELKRGDLDYFYKYSDGFICYLDKFVDEFYLLDIVDTQRIREKIARLKSETESMRIEIKTKQIAADLLSIKQYLYDITLLYNFSLQTNINEMQSVNGVPSVVRLIFAEVADEVRVMGFLNTITYNLSKYKHSIKREMLDKLKELANNRNAQILQGKLDKVYGVWQLREIEDNELLLNNYSIFDKKILQQRKALIDSKKQIIDAIEKKKKAMINAAKKQFQSIKDVDELARVHEAFSKTEYQQFRGENKDVDVNEKFFGDCATELERAFANRKMWIRILDNFQTRLDGCSDIKSVFNCDVNNEQVQGQRLYNSFKDIAKDWDALIADRICAILKDDISKMQSAQEIDDYCAKYLDEQNYGYCTEVLQNGNGNNLVEFLERLKTARLGEINSAGATISVSQP